MALATQTDLVCDKRSIPWSSLVFIITELGRRNLLGLVVPRNPDGKAFQSKGIRFFRLVDALHHQSPGTWNLAHLLVHSSFLEASDDRDRVFALLGLAYDATGPLFEPNYANTPSELFVSTAAELLRRGGSSNLILHCAGIGFDRKLFDLPSWVPDWTERDGSYELGVIAFLALYHADSNTTNTYHQQEEQILTLSGYIFDVITNLVPPRSRLEPRPGIANDMAEATAILRWKDSIQDLYLPSTVHPCGLPYYPDIVWRTLVASTTHTGVPAPVNFQQYFQDFILYSENTAAREKIDRLPQDPQISESVYIFLMALARHQYHRTVFISRQGYLGLGPPKIELGDKICVFLGFATPFIVRPREEGGYFLVGECHVYGLMDGEVLVGGTLEEIALH
ncbi:hypothetical protein VTL71DRAFT_13404 [Oculimacula yallundae]|uniref:Uncharacterized protein n=1 Tax=Oculimacula yallundae TaxID=86028 RepID=A0ABR4CKE4_9HELO